MSWRTNTIQRFDRGVEGLWKRIPEVVFWIFLVGSAAYLGRVGGAELWGTSGAATSTVFTVQNGVSEWAAPGLTFEGLPGAVLALVEAGIVLLGALLLFARRLRMRILGSMVVVGWAALWAGNAAAFASMSGGGTTWLLAAGYALPLAASMMVAMRRMGSGRRRRGRVRMARRRVLPRWNRCGSQKKAAPERMPELKSGAVEPVVA